MKKIDCFGDICPVPLLKAKKATAQLQPGEEVIIISDHSCTVESIEEFFEHLPFDIITEEVISGVWEIHLIRR